MAPTAQEPSLVSAADELAELLSEGAVQDRLILQRLPGLLTVLETAGLRLISFCQCFPERFSLRFLPGWGLRVSLAPASSESTLDLPLVENMLETVVVQHVERYHDKHSANEKAPAAPIGWLIRRIGPELDAYIAQAARGPLHFQLDPEASGFANLRLALRGSVACHVCEFVHARSEVFSWVEGPPCDEGAHASCHCQGAIALTPERAATVMAARRARLKADEVKREVKREAREARRAKEEAAMEEEPDGWREDLAAERPAAELLAACANLAHVSLSEGVALFEHDATLALPREGEAQGRGLAAQLVVTNPPWGKNIGTLDCGVPIVERLVAQHRDATFCFIVNSHALTALRAVEGLLVRRHVRLGGIEVVVACCAPGAGKSDD